MKKIFLSLVAVALLNGASAQTPMTLDECVKELTANNHDLYAAREGINVARANVLGSYSPFLPQVSASGSATRNNHRTVE